MANLINWGRPHLITQGVLGAGPVNLWEKRSFMWKQNCSLCFQLSRYADFEAA